MFFVANEFCLAVVKQTADTRLRVVNRTIINTGVMILFISLLNIILSYLKLILKFACR